MGGAALGHLLVVDPGQLRVLAAGDVGRAEQCGVQQQGPALLIGWPLRSVSPVSLALGAMPAWDLNRVA